MAIRGNDIGKALQAEGLIPDKCSLVDIRIPASGLVELLCTILVSREDLPKLARAMTAGAEVVKTDG